MSEQESVRAVRAFLSDYVESPSIDHIRDPRLLTKLAQQIVTHLDRRNPIWRKWDEQRERLLKSATACWVPTEDLRDFLNEMPGPALTATDVAERLKAFEEEPYSEYPNEKHRASCQDIYERERSEGTELPAIIRVLREHLDRERGRLRAEEEEQFQRQRSEERLAREQQLLSGADCGWTQPKGSAHWFYRSNGRLFRGCRLEKWALEGGRCRRRFRRRRRYLHR